MKQLIFAFVTVVWASQSHATLLEDFERLRDSGKDYQIIGTVCEEVARLEAERESFPAQDFEVVTGIAYGNGHRTIGELDVVVFDKRTGEVASIAEVKCWRKMGKGLHKAMEQRQRFLEAIRSNKVLEFRSTSSGHQTFQQARFENVTDFRSIAQKGAVEAGYTEELDYSLSELMELRQMMIKCQQNGQCSRP